MEREGVGEVVEEVEGEVVGVAGLTRSEAVRWPSFETGMVLKEEVSGEG